LVLGHNFLTTNARRQAKGSKDADFAWIFVQEKNKKLPLVVGARNQ